MNVLHIRKFFVQGIRLKHSWIKPEGYDTGVMVYNCTAKEKVPFIVRNKDYTTWYTCGPTVYESAHIGHASCYVKLDIIQRILRSYFKINLVTAMNITDVDDKIITKSKQINISTEELAQHYEKEFWEDMESLNIVKPNMVVRVTENIAVIASFINKLLASEYAYKSKNGSVVFNIKKSNNYGKLQNIHQKNTAESKNNIHDSIVDFTIWKTAKPNEPVWNINSGPGRPGWHTECSALASEIFGDSIDIHAGGIDLRFPHHENEEVQCCAYFSRPQWVNYWFHTGHLMQDSTKMSKSLKNTISIRDMLKICNADVFRIMCLMSHYRHNMEFSEDYIKTAERLLESYTNFVTNCSACISGKLKAVIKREVLNYNLMESVEKVHCALINDFDTATCIKIINSLITTTNAMLHSSATSTDNDLHGISSLSAVLNFVVNTFHLLGVNLNQKLSLSQDYSDTTELINILTEFRQNIRLIGIQVKNQELLQLCDSVRNNLKKCGIVVKDHGKLSSWSK